MSVILSDKHNGMKISLRGCLRATSSFGRDELAQHIELMGKEYYAGNTAIVDAFLQLYCVAEEERNAVVETQSSQPGATP